MMPDGLARMPRYLPVPLHDPHLLMPDPLQ